MAIFEGAGVALITPSVSYTHLDVYKRQEQPEDSATGFYSNLLIMPSIGL